MSAFNARVPNPNAQILRRPPGRARWVLGLGLWALGVAPGGCAARRVAIPSDAGVPLAGYAEIHAQLAEACTGTRTMTADIGLAGRLGREPLGGRVVAGFARPASMRLEGVAPFGPPAFVLAARDGQATLLLPRGGARVLKGARADLVVEALTGVALDPADLYAVLTGCVVPDPRPAHGRLHANGWTSIGLDGGAQLYADRAGGRWRLRAASRGAWRIEYDVREGRFPRSVRLRSAGAGPDVDLRATIRQLETNVEIDPAAFAVAAPPGATPITIDELRGLGPLRAEPGR